MSKRLVGLLLFLLCCCTSLLLAQTETGAISGTVVDSQKAVIPEVTVKLTSVNTAAVRETKTDARGQFTFNAVPMGVYNLSVEKTGFKRFEKQGINLMLNDRLGLGELALEVGAATDSVTVTAEGATVQSDSSDRAQLVTNQQISQLAVINRDYAALIALQPGVAANVSSDSQGFRGSSSFNVNGGRSNMNNLTIDGVPRENSNTGSTNAFVSMDAISAVKIENSIYQAEFGRKPGASIQAVTKSGTTQYHGSAYWYQRNEAFNAATPINKLKGLDEKPYRFITTGANIGGPVYIPGLVKKGQNKLFFFFSEEQGRESRPQNIVNLTVPTALERAGDFSQTFTYKNGVPTSLVPISDPTTGKAFPGNKIPAERINQFWQKYMNLLPLPNLTNNGSYNYQFQESIQAPKHNEVARVDYNLSSNTSIYGVFNNWFEEEKGANVSAASTTWGWLPSTYSPVARSLTLAGMHTFSPTFILEASVAGSRWTETAHPKQSDIDARTWAAIGATQLQFYKQNNPLKLLPQANFAGVTNAPNANYNGRFPIRGAENTFISNVSLTKVHGPHTMKAGVAIEHWQELKGENGNFAGGYNFNSGQNGYGVAQGNTGNPYANALLGNFYSYSENDTRPALRGRFNSLEWFAQDNWRVNSKLVLDIGVRFVWAQPFHSPENDEAGFVPSLYDFSKAVDFYRDTKSSVNPAPIAPAVGAVIPGVGDPYNGTVNRETNPSYPAGLRNTPGISIGPRFGFSYSPFSSNKTAIRGGFGMFYDGRTRDNYYVNTSTKPPLQNTTNIYYGNSSSLLDMLGKSYTFASGTAGFDVNYHRPYVMNYSLGIQQEVGFNTVLDVAYVGSASRHLTWQRNINAIPYGTMPVTGALPDQFYRKYLGYTNITMNEYGATANYNSLQVSANRRFSKSLQFTLAWTWSKTMDYVDSDDGSVTTLLDPRLWNYGKAGFDHTHIVKASFTWDAPKFSQYWNNSFSRSVFDGWTLSGMPSFQTGAPTGISYTTTSDSTAKKLAPTTISGSATDGARVNIIKNPLPSGLSRGTSGYFDTTAFAVPAYGNPGNAPRSVFTGPGLNNWDLALFKKIPLPTEKMNLLFRAEAFNAFNHANWTSIDTSAVFDKDAAQSSKTFGQVSQSAAGRRLQLSLRLSF